MVRPDVNAWTEKIRRWLQLDKMHPLLRTTVIGVAGGLFLGVGIVMIIAPGPAFVFISLGLLLLGSEFRWAKRTVQRGVTFFALIAGKVRKKRSARNPQTTPESRTNFIDN